MKNQDTLALLVQEAAKVLSPLRVAISSPERFKTFMARLGWTVDDIPQPIRDLGSDLDTLITQLKVVTDGDVGLEAINDLREAVVNLVDSIKAIASAPDAAFPPHLVADNFKDEFPSQLITYLIVDYLTRNHPTAAFALRALGVMQRVYELPTGNRRPFIRSTFQFSNLAKVLEDPSIVFANAFGWGTDSPDYNALFEQLDSLLIYLGFAVFRSEMDQRVARKVEEGIENPGSPRRSVLRAVFFERTRTDGTRLAAELAFLPLPGDGVTKPGLALLPFFNGVLGFSMQLGNDIAVTLDADFDIQGGVGLIFRPDQDLKVLRGFDSDEAPTIAQGSILVRADYDSAGGEPSVLLGSADGSRLEVRNVSGTGGLRLSTTGPKAEIFSEFDLQGGRVVIDTSKGDGFLTHILPANGLSANLDLTVGLSSLEGFYFRGSGGLEIQRSLNVSIGPINLQSIVIGLRTESGAIRADLGASVMTELGPLTAVVRELGLRATLSFPDTGGNLGVADLDIGFKPPSGIGLSIDGGGFKGGGFIGFEPEEAFYSGMLELEFQDQFTLKAFALLNTRLPNGQSGFSLLIIISSEFTPIQLGLGFKLNEVGGLLGLNRTINIEPLRAGLRANTLSSILFPTDVVANADRIISDLKQVFPPQEGRFIFGPMAKITWGTPTLVSIDLGLVIEVPDPVRLALLGVLRAILPGENAAILRVQVNFLGEVNFERRQLKFDASLFDSKLLSFTLSGDMAIRLDWGADANFLLTVGGFHPAYEPPPMDLPAIRRLTLSLLSGDNPRLRLEMYLAVTSNTAQFGAKLELFASASKFNVYGFLSFDVLFQFNPFYFIAEITAMLALRVGSSSIASIKLTLTLEGPTPWKAKGDARLKLCWFLTVKIRFNKTFGESRTTTLPDLAVLPLLAEALKANDNWEAELPVQRHRLESIRETPELTSELLLHPVGTLKVSQKVVPLNVRIDRIGSQRPSDGREFQIVTPQPPATSNKPQEAFAPAQFFDLTDEQKLTSASFKDLDSGIRVGDATQLHTGYAAARAVEYEVKYIDSQRDQRLSGGGKHVLDVGAFNSWTLQGAIAQSELSFARKRKSNLAPEAVVVSQESFAIVKSGDLKLFDELSLLGSEHAAVARLNELLQTNPTLHNTLQVVPAFELAA
jgi:hypothetical protein